MDDEVEQRLQRFPDYLRDQIRPSAVVAGSIVGLDVAEARAIALAAGVRVEVEDLEDLRARTMEMIIGRIVLRTRKGIVEEVSLG